MVGMMLHQDASTHAWRDILCVQEERTAGNDNTVKWKRLSLQPPPSRLCAHFVKATVRVHEYPAGELAVYWGPNARHGIVCGLWQQPRPCSSAGRPGVEIWDNAGPIPFAGLIALQADYTRWVEALPEATRNTPTGEALQAIADLDLEEIAAIRPPRDFGCD